MHLWKKNFLITDIKSRSHVSIHINFTMEVKMGKNEKTSKSVASKAAKLLRDPKTPKSVKSVAASALTQRPDKKKK